MFTVKATYRGETRKLSFPECSSFPSFDQLYNQLYRVFPISNNYFLSKLLFSPDSTSSRILLSREVHNAFEYNQAIAQFVGRLFPKPLLRFAVFDETPHKVRNVPSNGSLITSQKFQSTPSADSTGLLTAFPPISLAHIPPPPIIYSSPNTSDSRLMDFDNLVPTSATSTPQQFQSATPPQRASDTSADTLVAVEALMTRFKTDLDCILLQHSPNLDGSASVNQSDLPLFGTATPSDSNPLCLYKFCFPCGKIFQGPWYSCIRCSQVVCPSCHISPSLKLGMCATGGFAGHVFKKETCPACPKSPQSSLSPLRSPFLPPPSRTPVFRSLFPPPPAPAPTTFPLPPVVRNATQAVPPLSFPIRAQSMAASQVPISEPPRTLPSVSAPYRAPQPAEDGQRTPVAERQEPVLEPAVHRGVTCDACETHPIQGVRHKCLDCLDYDLCTPCIESSMAERHNPFHEFIEIKEPGRVVVHTVNSAPPVPPPAPQPRNRDPVVHNATCDLCDSRIVGHRYKCCVCPDFDSCQSCYSIVNEQHPEHSFVRLKETSDYLPAETGERALHYASCNDCLKGINGVRYKCMHPNCPDFDLCEDCEAHPISVHPRNHPMLKLKSADTLIPTVYRAGVHHDEPILPMNRTTSTASTRQSDRFNDGYLRNPARGTVATPSSPLVAPPSPFFDPITRTPSPPLLIPGAMPNLNFETPPRAPSVVLPPVTLLPQPVVNTVPDWGFDPLEQWPPAPESPQQTSGLPPWRVDGFSLPSASKSRNESLVPSLDSSFTTSKIQLPPLSLNDSWPRSSELLEHLMGKVENIEPVVQNVFGAAIEDSPLTGKEPLLSRPEPSVIAQQATLDVKRPPLGLAELLNVSEASSPVPSSLVSPIEESEKAFSIKEEKVAGNDTLHAEFVADVTVPDGQVFPPGAEFVKCWKMVNSGKMDWPESTELVFLAGESMSGRKGLSNHSVKLGVVKAGKEIEVTTDELKAPEIPGRYVSYWRLKDGEVPFGDNIWIDIVVEETGERSKDASDSSLSSSSVIVMPQLTAAEQEERASVTHTSASNADDDAALSETESDASSLSLVSMPSSDEEWEDTRDIIPESGEYVVLFDERDSSSEEE